jgi:hypothetical protein|tara:strand:+ start:8716 stop:9294 length:579 start_codon:yes stop_codon:yes gene_type:complete
MKVLPFDLNTTSSKPEGKQEYLKPGAHHCKVVSITTSDLIDNYKGSPFITFNVTSNNKNGRVQMWAVKQTDKPSTQDWKKKQMKDFLVNAGVSDFSDDSKAMNDVIGKDLMITFISEEYVTVNRETGEPVIREAVKYRWSNKAGANCAYSPDMNKKLSNEDRDKYKVMMKDYQGTSASVENADGMTDEDMPF